MNKKIFFFFFFGFILQNITYSQAHSWALNFRSTGTSGTAIAAMATNTNGDVYVGGNFRDTIFIGKDTHVFTGLNSTGLFLAKYNSDGQFLWSKSITNAASTTLIDIKVNSKGKVLIYGHYRTTVTLPTVTFGAFSLSRNRGVFITFMDSSGSFTDAVDLAYAGTVANGWKIDLGPNDEIFTYNYLNGFSGGYTINSTTSPVTGSTFIYAICKHDSTGKILRWSTILNLNDHVEAGAITTDDNGDVYYGFRAGRNRTINGLASGMETPIFIVKANGINGNVLKTIKSSTGKRGRLQDMATINNQLYIQGFTINDSFNILDTSLKANGASAANRPFYYLARLQGLDSLLWGVTSNYNFTDFVGQSNLTTSGDFIYSSYDISTDSFKIGGLRVTSPTKINSTVCKFDTLGNPLWILKNPSLSPPLVKPIGRSDLVYSGTFINSATFTPFTLSNPTIRTWPFIARTIDYQIFRGDVRTGPFCAGDTLNIPYTKEGQYDTANKFIAEISDEQGQFLGKERVLGSLKTTEDSIIKGVLPLLQVPTSTKYRIRVRSTTPAVASFFKEDTLQLLIYSRDKADPGKDTSICVGDTFQLNTFGGTAWKWSPNINMDDSLLRTPNIWPDTATTYQIIISDSSGCGAPDTAKIRISLKPLPKITNASVSDTTACVGQSIKLRANFEGGIKAYTANWQDENGKVLQLTTTSKKDSFEFIFKQDTVVRLILTDSCANINDTATFSIIAKPQLIKTTITKDTLVCKGVDIKLTYEYTHPVKDSINIIWSNSNSDSLSNTFQYSQNVNITDTFYATVLNKCNLTSTLDSVIVTSRDAPETNIMGNQNFYCTSKIISLAENSKGGTGQYFYAWKIDGTLLSDSNKLVIGTDEIILQFGEKDSFKVVLTVTDSCSVMEANDSIWIKIKPKLSFTTKPILDSIFCKGTNYTVGLPVTGGTGDYKFLWKLASLSSNDSVWQINTSNIGNGTYELRSIVTDNCSLPDTFSKFVLIPDSLSTALQQVVDTLEICNGESIVLKPNNKGGNAENYRSIWSINNFDFILDSLNLTPEKLNWYQDSGFWVNLRLSDGCSNYTAKDSIYIDILNSPIASLSNNKTNGYQQFDTTLCYGQKWLIRPTTFFGNKTQYTYQWIYDSTIIGNTNTVQFDTSIFSGNDTTIRLRYILGDNCSQSDTLNINITILKTLSIEKLQDSTVCFGSSLTKSIIVLGGKQPQLSYQWKNLDDNLVIGNNSNLILTEVKKSMTIAVLANDNCSNPGINDTFNISVLDSLQLSVTPKDSCVQNNVTLNVNRSGGIASDYSYSWWVNNRLQSAITPQLNLTSIDSTLSYKTILSDNCSNSSDTFYGKIQPFPLFSYSAISDTVCEPYNTTLNLQATSKSILSYELYLNNIAQSDVNNLNLNKGKYNLKIISSNSLGCKDSVEQDILVKPKPDSGFTFSPENPNDDNPTVTFTANRNDYTSYKWQLDNSVINENSSFAYLFKDSGIYSMNLEVSLDNCFSDSTRKIRFSRSFAYYGVNSFSPNGDGINDFYQPKYTGVSEVYYEVFNRWGEKVHDSKEQGLVWDGNYLGKPVPDGQYIILLFARDAGKQRKNTKQTLLIIR